MTNIAPPNSTTIHLVPDVWLVNGLGRQCLNRAGDNPFISISKPKSDFKLLVNRVRNQKLGIKKEYLLPIFQGGLKW